MMTGAGGGLGRAYAHPLASRGARVVVNDRRAGVSGRGSSVRPAESVVREIQDPGGSTVPDSNSVATPYGSQAIVETALDAFGRIDALINNTGILRDRTFAKITSDEIDADPALVAPVAALLVHEDCPVSGGRVTHFFVDRTHGREAGTHRRRREGWVRAHPRASGLHRAHKCTRGDRGIAPDPRRARMTQSRARVA